MSKQFLLENPEIWGPRGLGLKATLVRWQSAQHGDRRPRHDLTQRQRTAGLLPDPLGRAQPKLSSCQSDHRSLLRRPARKESTGCRRRCQSTRQRQRRRHQESPDGPSSAANANGAAPARKAARTRHLRLSAKPAARPIAGYSTPSCSARTSAIPAANINCRRSRAASRPAASV